MTSEKPAGRPGPKRVSELLGDLLAELAPRKERAELSRSLRQVMGERADACRIVGYRRGHLVVEVDSAPLFAELRGFAEEEIRAALNTRGPRVGRLTFRMGGTAHA